MKVKSGISCSPEIRIYQKSSHFISIFCFFDFVTDPFESVNLRRVLLPPCHSCQQKETKFHAEAKFHSLVKGGELQAGALQVRPPHGPGAELL